MESYAKGQLDQVLRNPYIMAVLKVSLALYAAQMAPRLSPVVSGIFQYTLVKIVSVFLIAYFADVDFQLSILLAIIFVLSINLFAGRSPFESFGNSGAPFSASQVDFKDLLGKATQKNGITILEGKTDIYPGCTDIKLKDLLEVFDNDALKLQKGVQYTYNELMKKMPQGEAKQNLQKMARYAGLPYSVELSDENAPFIATILLQVGYFINDSCSAPQ